MQAQLASKPLVICHGGMGIIGEALRAGCRIICVPRDRPTSRHHLSNDQRDFVQALAARLPIGVCLDLAKLPELLVQLSLEPSAAQAALPESDIPEILAAFLTRRTVPAASR